LIVLQKSRKKNKLLDKSRFELTDRRRADIFLPPWQAPIHKLNMTSMIWNISIASLSGCALSQHLHTCSLAEHEKQEKVRHFVATTENISLINFLLVLNPKRSSY